MRLVNGQIVNVQAYKHDGTLYRQWNGVKVIEASPERWVLFMFKTKVSEKSGQRWIVREPIIWWMPRESFSNTTGLIRPTGTYYYTNLASPPIYEDGAIKFIDYDLDIKAYPDAPIKVVDKNEYEKHKVEYGYPEKLCEIIERTTERIIKQIKLKDEFFDEDVIDEYLEELVDERLISKKFALTKKL